MRSSIGILPHRCRKETKKLISNVRFKFQSDHRSKLLHNRHFLTFVLLFVSHFTQVL